MRKTSKYAKKIESLYFAEQEYFTLLNNQLVVQNILERLNNKLYNNEVAGDIREYLSLDESFAIELDTNSIVVDYTIVGVNVEACVFLNMKILSDGKSIGKNEQLFFYIVNDKVDIDII